MEPLDSAITDTVPDAATAAAAAALIALPQPAAATPGESTAVLAIMSSFVQATTSANQCSCGLRMLLCRCPAATGWYE